jgi:DnaK suppressor protein
MTPERLAAFKDRLRAMQADLAADDARGRSGQQTVDLDQQAVGRLSRMDALQNQAMAQAGGRRREVQTRRIAAALERIEDGTFGECLDCGEDIPLRRLDLDPTIALCVSCAAG